MAQIEMVNARNIFIERYDGYTRQQPARSLEYWASTYRLTSLLNSIGVSRTFASEQETLICDVSTTLW